MKNKITNIVVSVYNGIGWGLFLYSFYNKMNDLPVYSLLLFVGTLMAISGIFLIIFTKDM